MVKTAIKGITPNLQWLKDLMALFQTEQIKIPSLYRDKVIAVKKLTNADTSGLLNTLIDFAITSAMVNYRVETDNPNLTKVLNDWIKNLNMEHIGKIPTGLQALSKEYFRERWKGSSQLLLRTFWNKEPRNLSLPTTMFFVDGEDIVIKNPKNQPIMLGDEEYALKINTNPKDDVPLPKLKNEMIFVQKPFESWGTREPTPFIIKRGLYRNAKFLELLEQKGEHVVSRALEYLMVVKKGTENMALSGRAELTYDENDLKALSDDLRNFLLKLRNEGGTPHYTTNFDTEIEHMIPEYKNILEGILYGPIEKRILQGMGMVDVVDSAASTRRESILNPKPFMEEVRQGINDFTLMLEDIIKLIVRDNTTSHRKWMNATIKVHHSPIKSFMNDKFRQMLRSAYDRGCLSKQTFVEIVAEGDYELERQRRKDEKADGDEKLMFAPVIQNVDGASEEKANEPTKPKDNVPDDKKGVEKKNSQSQGNLEEAFCPECGADLDIDLEGEIEDGEEFVDCPACETEIELARIIGKPVDPKRDSIGVKKTKSKGKIEFEEGRIVKRKDGWYVLSKEGKNLGGPYPTRKEALKRLRQVEHFKK